MVIVGVFAVEAVLCAAWGLWPHRERFRAAFLRKLRNGTDGIIYSNGYSVYVPENAAGRRIIVRCFTYEDLAYLMEQPTFRDSLATMVSLTDCDAAVLLGHRLLHDRDYKNRDSKERAPAFADRGL